VKSEKCAIPQSCSSTTVTAGIEASFCIHFNMSYVNRFFRQLQKYTCQSLPISGIYGVVLNTSGG